MQECHESLEWMSRKRAKSLRKCLLQLCSWEFPVQWNCVQIRHGNLSTTTYRNRSSLRGTPKPFPTCPPVSIPKGGGGGGGPPPPPSNQFPFNWNQFHGGGGGGSYWFYQSFRGGGGGGGGWGWRALSFDKSILSRGQINFQPTPIFVNKNSSFALPELAFVTDSHDTSHFSRATKDFKAMVKFSRSAVCTSLPSLRIRFTFS